ncbi:helix-turn-helix transcriptional regulator [Tsukamurella conjunctivitidis]|uniref:Helix-turn-helix transcriptional regulator n=1 Tax=Tsukamurella conjunctivitidis TaxID=2592068 RepID=A0A5C5RS76_9ACTN|nr:MULTISPECIES: helix-turn-helix transcriptional regulator [Tsukamurella]RDB48048.1 XRE family transcriptional regulator [Tsukamurella tyrosinosolvens]TWS25614.1 helix-turn-helix transcriptional regulator [Tsukamurella conjunctivitidis]
MTEDQAARLKELGERLRAAREGVDETQSRAAESVGLHRTYISRVENGGENITVGALYRLADHYGVPASRILPD